MLKSQTTGTATLVELTDGSKFLIVQIDINCAVCGQHAVKFAGHHLRAIREFLTATIDEYPDQCLREGDVQVLETLRFEGTAPPKPETN